MKKCGKCKKTKPLSSFFKKSNSVDGHQGYCKQCSREYRCKHYEEQPEYYKNYAKNWRRKNKDRDNFLRRKRRRLGKERQKNLAVTRSQQAEKQGLIVRPLFCEECGLKKKLYRHHEDYSKPLEIDWLCKKCHLALHKKKRRIAQSALLKN